MRLMQEVDKGVPHPSSHHQRLPRSPDIAQEVSIRSDNPFAPLIPIEIPSISSVDDVLELHLHVPSCHPPANVIKPSSPTSWGKLFSEKLKCAANGAGFRPKPRKPKSKKAAVLPDVDEINEDEVVKDDVDVGNPTSSCEHDMHAEHVGMDTTMPCIRHMTFSDATSLRTNVTHNVTEKVRIHLDIVGEHVSLQLNVYEGASHTILYANKPPKVCDPTKPKGRKVGGCRKSYVLPYFTDREHWELQR